MKLIFYDFEIFKFNWLIVFIEKETKEKTIIINNNEKLLEFYNKNKDNIFVGYNSRMYDTHIFKAILLDMNPHEVSNQLIQGDKNGYQIVKDNGEYPINNFDVSTGFHSLKQLEGFLGSKIKESSIDFNINRKLTEKEIQEVIEYCIHDVEQTIEVFNNRKEEFDSHLALIQTFDLDMKMFNKTKTQMGSYILGAKKVLRDDEFELLFPDTLKIDKYKHIVDWYKDINNRDYKKSLLINVAEVPHVFAWGGVHGAIDNYSYEGLILCCDVSSLYPSIMIEYGFLSRNVSHPEKFKEIRDKRLELKAKKDPRQAPMKIVINGSYGGQKDKNNDLYDPLMANNICVAGQLLLLDLIEKLEPYCKLIQSNTDGLFLQIEKEDDIQFIKNIAKEWEIRTRLDLEWDLYSKIYQKDVNNYIIINEKGKYKSKGAYVKKLSNIDYDMAVVNNALINYFVNNTPIEDTINNCDKLRDFQKIVKTSNKYLYSLHGDKKIREKVNRVFASKNENDPGIFKVKEGGNPEKIGNTPEHCFIYNDDVRNTPIPDYLDKQYYIDISNKRLSDFINPKVRKTAKLQSEIKFVNAEVKQEILNILEKKYETFVDLLVELTENTSANVKQIEILTKLNYFKEYSRNQKLLNIIENFTKGKIKYSKNYIEKTKLERLRLLKELENTIEDIAIPILEQMKIDIEYVGKPITIYSELKSQGYILNVNTNYSPKIQMYGLSTGNIIDMKITAKDYKKNPINKCDIIKIINHKIKPKNQLMDGKWTPIPDSKEYWIEKFEKMYY